MKINYSPNKKNTYSHVLTKLPKHSRVSQSEFYVMSNLIMNFITNFIGYVIMNFIANVINFISIVSVNIIINVAIPMLLLMVLLLQLVILFLTMEAAIDEDE